MAVLLLYSSLVQLQSVPLNAHLNYPAMGAGTRQPLPAVLNSWISTWFFSDPLLASFLSAC